MLAISQLPSFISQLETSTVFTKWKIGFFVVATSQFSMRLFIRSLIPSNLVLTPSPSSYTATCHKQAYSTAAGRQNVQLQKHHRVASSLSSSSSSTIFFPYHSRIPQLQYRYFSSEARLEKQIEYNKKHFFDRVRVQCTGGVGCSGCSSFARTMDGKGPPDGGDGGSGGNVFVRASDRSSNGLNLTSFHFKGGKGGNGGSDKQLGRRGEDIFIDIPVGCTVEQIVGKDSATGEVITKMIADITSPQTILVAKGGRGGQGNRSLTTEYRSNNRFSTVGEKGESLWLRIRLRTMADVGLVGFPNAGKSSLLDVLSRAQPKIASYPFTTLAPQVGVIQVGDKPWNRRHGRNDNVSGSKKSAQYSDNETDHFSRALGVIEAKNEIVGKSSLEETVASLTTSADSFIMADLPGLIENAHQNVGLGHAFLAHLERCSVLLYVIDVSGADERVPSESWLTLVNEVREYDPQLLRKPALIFANKMDFDKSLCDKNLRNLRAAVALAQSKELPGSNIRVFSGSCLEKKGLTRLVNALNSMIQEGKRMNK